MHKLDPLPGRNYFPLSLFGQLLLVTVLHHHRSLGPLHVCEF